MMADVSLSDNMRYGLVGKSNVISGDSGPSDPMTEENILDDIPVHDNPIYGLMQTATAIRSNRKKHTAARNKKHHNFMASSCILILSMLTVTMSLIVIISCIVFVYAGTLLCDCTVMDNTGNATTAINQVNEHEIKLNYDELRDRLQKLKQNVSLPVLTNRLSGIVSDVSSLNQSVLDLRQEANETVRIDNLQAPANVRFNSSHHHDCVVEHNKGTCTFFDFTKYFCRSVGADFIVNNMVIVDFNCYTTSVDNSVITASQVAIQVNDFSASLASQINNAQLSCMCTSFGKADGTCNVFITRCPYTSSNISASFST